MKFWRSHLLIACAASTATALVVGGIAFATIPNNLDGSITACMTTVAPNKGQIRIIDHQAGRACRRGEQTVSWPTRGFRWRGEWSGSGAYKINDVVSYNGSSYIALTPTTNVLPVSAGYWSVMSAAGTGTGTTGATGATGAAGATGATGAAGITTCSFPHQGVNWTGCDFTGALLSFQNLSSSNLTGANLSGASLGTTNLTTANLTNVNLTNANLTSANLTGATGLASATVTGVTWSNTTCPDGTLSDSNAGTCVGH